MIRLQSGQVRPGTPPYSPADYDVVLGSKTTLEILDEELDTSQSSAPPTFNPITISDAKKAEKNAIVGQFLPFRPFLWNRAIEIYHRHRGDRVQSGGSDEGPDRCA